MRAASILFLAAAAGCAGPSKEPTPFDGGLRALRELADRSKPDADPSTADVLVAPDAAFVERHGPETARVLEAAVAAADRVLGPETGLRFRIAGAVVFPAPPEVRDDLRLLWEARLTLDRGACDVVAAFTGQECGPRAGAAEPRLRLLLCADGTDPEANLVHEAAHLFGAQDYRRDHPGYALPSVLSYDSDRRRTLDLDAPNLARVRARAGSLPKAEPDRAAEGLAARMRALPPGERAALRGAFLCAESRDSQGDGLAAADRVLSTHPGEAAALWAKGECLRVLRRPEEAAPRLLTALEAIAGSAHAPDGLDRHIALETARIAVDGVDGLEILRASAEAALARVDAAFPGDAEVLDLRASLRARAGDREGAEPMYRAAIQADPAAVYPRRHLASLGKSSGDADLWLEGWRAALAADPLDPVLGVRFVEDGLEAFPATIRGVARGEALALLDAGERAFPKWTDPARLRVLLGE